MQIEKNKVVTFHYRLSEAGNDEALESSHDRDPLAYLHGRGTILKGLEQALEGKQNGDQVNVSLPPEQAYGPRREDAQQRIPIKHLILGKNKKLRVGQIVAVNTQQGQREATIVKVGRFNVDVDSNHPLAGKTLVFDVEIVDVRDATEEEIAHGHAHGVGGHQH